MTLLADFGGFNDGVSLLPALLMASYNARMFRAAQFSYFPIKRKSKPRKKNRVQRKFAQDKPLGQALAPEDIESMNKEASFIDFETIAWVKSLLCCYLCCCKRDRKLKLLSKSTTSIDK